MVSNNLNNILKSSKGMTLIEIIVAVVMIVLLMGVTMVYLPGYRNQQLIEQMSKDVEDSLRQAQTLAYNPEDSKALYYRWQINTDSASDEKCGDNDFIVITSSSKPDQVIDKLCLDGRIDLAQIDIADNDLYFQVKSGRIFEDNSLQVPASGSLKLNVGADPNNPNLNREIQISADLFYAYQQEVDQEGDTNLTAPACPNGVCQSELGENCSTCPADCGVCQEIRGCTDESATNYNAEATADDGSCKYSEIAGCMDEQADNFEPYATVDLPDQCIYNGCTDPIAQNYWPKANIDDGSCEYILGCTDSTAHNFDPAATKDDGSCDHNVYGCTNSAADNYNPEATKDDDSCIISGCTNSAADNYNPEANRDDGSCVISGCTDSTAVNYNINANNDDGSCNYCGNKACDHGETYQTCSQDCKVDLPNCRSGAYCTYDYQCGGGRCLPYSIASGRCDCTEPLDTTKLPDNSKCSVGTQCQSGSCMFYSGWNEYRCYSAVISSYYCKYYPYFFRCS